MDRPLLERGDQIDRNVLKRRSFNFAQRREVNRASDYIRRIDRQTDNWHRDVVCPTRRVKKKTRKFINAKRNFQDDGRGVCQSRVGGLDAEETGRRRTSGTVMNPSTQPELL